MRFAISEATKKAEGSREAVGNSRELVIEFWEVEVEFWDVKLDCLPLVNELSNVHRLSGGDVADERLKPVLCNESKDVLRILFSLAIRLDPTIAVPPATRYSSK